MILGLSYSCGSLFAAVGAREIGDNDRRLIGERQGLDVGQIEQAVEMLLFEADVITMENLVADGHETYARGDSFDICPPVRWQRAGEKLRSGADIGIRCRSGLFRFAGIGARLSRAAPSRLRAGRSEVRGVMGRRRDTVARAGPNPSVASGDLRVNCRALSRRSGGSPTLSGQVSAGPRFPSARPGLARGGRFERAPRSAQAGAVPVLGGTTARAAGGVADWSHRGSKVSVTDDW